MFHAMMTQENSLVPHNAEVHQILSC